MLPKVAALTIKAQAQLIADLNSGSLSNRTREYSGRNRSDFMRTEEGSDYNLSILNSKII